jgi:hypothetical protein
MKTNFSKFIMGTCIAGGLVFGVSSCKDEEVLPPIGGFNTSDEVGGTALVAHWPMEGNGNEKKSGKAPASAVNATFGTGAKGQAVNLALGYLAYDEIAALNSLPNATVSLWAKFDNNGASATNLFTLTRPGEWAGNINLLSETGWRKAGLDTLVLKGLIVKKKEDGGANEPSKGGVQVIKGINTWNHIVMTWDGATSNFKIYKDGVKVSNPEWEQRGTTGLLNFFTPTKAVIGAFGSNLPGGTAEAWQKPLNGSIDEVRVYNKSLTDAEISALFQLEKAGR